MGDSRAERALRSLEGVAYWAAIAPLLSRLPAAIGYRAACGRGDWLFRRQTAKRAELVRNLGLLGIGLGEGLREELGEGRRDGPGPAAAQQVARDWFRFASCEALDVMRLRRGTRPLRRLVEIRGREHLEAALAGGKGAILCGAHFGSYNSSYSLLHASGFPITSIGRWQYKYTAGLSSAERRFWDLVYRRLRRYRQRPNIEPWPGRVEVAALAAAALRANEVVTIAIDAPPLDTDLARAVEVAVLGRRAKLLPGVVTLARLTGAPVLMCFQYRAADYRHQVLEISAPVPMDGDVTTAFGRCAARVSAAIERGPAHWAYWTSTPDLQTLELRGPAPVPSPAGPGRHRASDRVTIPA